VPAVDAARQRAAEAAKFGFESCMLPRGCAADAPPGAGVVAVARLTEAIRLGLEG
jgi:predicted ATP-dependent serine protease